MAAPYPTVKMFIDGAWTNGSTEASEPILNPATDEVLGQVVERDPKKTVSPAKRP